MDERRRSGADEAMRTVAGATVGNDLLGAAKEAEFWLEGALQCKSWHWDDDQREAAEYSLVRLRAAMGAAA
ncbi:hypothetical protein GOL82_16325 [Sinorhizobium medicae]|nr:hypothetical protein [Sinorhizobium medicae]